MSSCARTYRAILKDDVSYPDPGVLRPERFLGDTPQPDPQIVCFGFGRRYVYYLADNACVLRSPPVIIFTALYCTRICPGENLQVLRTQS